jgi:PAS domain S-box-containing protein
MIHDMIDSAAYMAHGYCLLWKPWLIAVHAGSDWLIALSYFAISFAIWLFVKRRKDLELKPLAFMFAAFIFLCGCTHLIQGATLWWPIYETQAYAKLLTAAVSVATAVVIFPLIPQALAIPSPRQLQAANEGLAGEILAHRQTLAELRQAKDELEARVLERTRELEHSKARFEALVRASAQIVWTRDAAGQFAEDCSSWRAFTGQSFDEMKGSGWLKAVHPSDRNAIAKAWAGALQSKQTYSAEYRLRHAPSGWRWTAAKSVPLFAGDGGVSEWVGMNVDIDGRRRTEDHMRFVMKELSHRTKNLLMVIYSMVRQAGKHARMPDFISDFSARIEGLAKSHDLLVSSDWTGAPIEEHLKAQLAPFADVDSQRIRISGPRLMLGPAATQALGLAFHELATNALKYGALKHPEGAIDVTWEVVKNGSSEIFRLAWRECKRASGPACLDEHGFGFTVLNRVVPEALSGEVRWQLEGDGIVWELKAPLHEVLPRPDRDGALAF